MPRESLWNLSPFSKLLSGWHCRSLTLGRWETGPVSVDTAAPQTVWQACQQGPPAGTNSTNTNHWPGRRPPLSSVVFTVCCFEPPGRPPAQPLSRVRLAHTPPSSASRKSSPLLQIFLQHAHEADREVLWILYESLLTVAPPPSPKTYPSTHPTIHPLTFWCRRGLSRAAAAVTAAYAHTHTHTHPSCLPVVPSHTQSTLPTSIGGFWCWCMRLLRSTVLLGCLDWHALLPSWSSETMLVPSRALAANADLSPNAVIVYPSLPFVFFLHLLPSWKCYMQIQCS